MFDWKLFRINALNKIQKVNYAMLLIGQNHIYLINNYNFIQYK